MESRKRSGRVGKNEANRTPTFLPKGPASVPYKCDDRHRWRLNARPGDRCFCGVKRFERKEE